MGTYRADTIITVVGTILLLPLAMLPILARVTRRYGGLRGWPTLAAVGLLGSTVALAAFTVFPLPEPDSLECTGGTLSSYWQTDWFASIALIGDVWAQVGLPAVLWSSAFLQVLLNVVLFVPYGFFLHQVTRWRVPMVVLAGLGTSALIEVTQGTGVFWLYPCPYRLLDVDDLIVNTLGAAFGVLLSVAAARLRWTHPEPHADLDRPTIARRIIAASIDFGLVYFVWIVAEIVWHAVRHTDGPDLVLAPGSALVLVVLFPLLRKDRATPGELVVNVAPARRANPAASARAHQVLVRAVVRWLPIVVFSAVAVPVVVAVECIALAANRSRQSFAGLVSGTITVTRPTLASHVLPGGNMGGAVRIGDTVRKPSQPHSATVQRLAAHVRAHGATWVAEPLGTDELGRDVWRFIPGEVSHEDPHEGYPCEVIEDVARRLRQWHDATVTFPPSADDVWSQPPREPAEVICHSDFAPYNHVFVGGHFVGAFDLDLSHFAPRLWDLGYTAYRYIPLTPDADPEVVARRLTRLRAFLAAYAGDDDALLYPASDLLRYTLARLEAMVEWCESQDSPDRRRDAVMYRSHAQWIASGGYGEVARQSRQ